MSPGLWWPLFRASYEQSPWWKSKFLLKCQTLDLTCIDLNETHAISFCPIPKIPMPTDVFHDAQLCIHHPDTMATEVLGRFRPGSNVHGNVIGLFGTTGMNSTV